MKVSSGLSDLSTTAPEAQRVSVEMARAAYADFQKIHREVLLLSRRNSDVRSLALSLGRKREITAQCMDQLRLLQAAVRPVFNATR